MIDALEAMESWLRIHQIRLTDCQRRAEPMREEFRDNAMKESTANLGHETGGALPMQMSMVA